jgi:ankyrin repeat protein
MMTALLSFVVSAFVVDSFQPIAPLNIGWTASHNVSTSDYLEVVKFMLDRSHVHATDTNGDTPMHSITENGKLDVQQYVME